MRQIGMISESVSWAASPNLGFVVAMRAQAAGAAPAEWLIVARWERGGMLSISWTGAIAACDDAPLDLAPKRTVIGVREGADEAGCHTSFQLLAAQPVNVTVAGLFIPAAGTVRLSGANCGLRLRCMGRALADVTARRWDLKAGRAPWIGEFV